jgi:lysophospholipase L1-like esterase
MEASEGLAGNVIYSCEHEASGSITFTDTKIPGQKCKARSSPENNTRAISIELNSIVRRKHGDVEELVNSVPSSRSTSARRNKTPVVKENTPSFINVTSNQFEAASPDVLKLFLRRWRSKGDPVRILHLGDSHVRNGFSGEAARRELQLVRGNGGRGMLFPYALARTYPQSDYGSTMEGRWQSGSSVRPLQGMDFGITGFGARTTSTPSAFTLSLKQPQPIGRKVVKVFFKSSMKDLRLTASVGREHVTSSPSVAQEVFTVAEFVFYDQIESLRIDISSEPAAGYFELHGVNIEGPSSGVIYHSFGVDGATLVSLSAASHIDNQLKVLQPDLIVLDFGSNELISGDNALSPQSEATIVQLIRRLRSARPQALIVFSTPQDMKLKQKNLTAVGAYAQFVRKIAFDNGCLFWDWHRVSGGAGSMRLWSSSGLANRDQVHLLPKGYKLKGELLANALLNTVNKIELDR